MRDRRLAKGDDDDDFDLDFDDVFDDDGFDDDGFDDERRPGSPDRMPPGVLAALEDYLVQQEGVAGRVDSGPGRAHAPPGCRRPDPS